MADNNIPSNKLTTAVKTAAIGGVLLLFSPVLIIFSPVLVPAYILYWIYRYATGKKPAGSDLVAKAQDKIMDTAAGVKDKVVKAGENLVDTAEDVKNKVTETGQKIVDAAEDLAKNNVVTKTGEKIADVAEDLAKDNVVIKTGEKIVDTAEDLVKGGVSQVGEGAKNVVDKLGKDIWKLGGGGAAKSAGK